MQFTNFKLTDKKNLTEDVFLLTFESEKELNTKPGQFMTFMLPKTGFGRAYSILDQKGNSFYFIIRRVENGRGGSKEICDYNVGVTLKGIGPCGHLLLSKKQNNKLFFSTGTGMVPFYFMIKGLIKKGYNKNITLIIGNREFEDLYFLDKFEEFKKLNKNFDFKVYLSQEKKTGFGYGYISEFITKEIISSFEEFYICGNPYMIDDVEGKLKQNLVENESIFKEKY